MTDALAVVTGVLALLDHLRVPCHLFGGWAEELLGLRPPGPHRDIDLVHLAPSFEAIDRALASGGLGREIVPKRFPHKRAFLVDAICCEILLIDPSTDPPLTWFWGDVRFSWQRPLLEPERAGKTISTLSRANLLHYRAQHRRLEPERWRSFQPSWLAACSRSNP